MGKLINLLSKVNTALAKFKNYLGVADAVCENYKYKGDSRGINELRGENVAKILLLGYGGLDDAKKIRTEIIDTTPEDGYDRMLIKECYIPQLNSRIDEGVEFKRTRNRDNFGRQLELLLVDCRGEIWNKDSVIMHKDRGDSNESVTEGGVMESLRYCIDKLAGRTEMGGKVIEGFDRDGKYGNMIRRAREILAAYSLERRQIVLMD